MANVTYSEVCKNFGSVKVIDELSLEIKGGAFVVLLGASGCGKTTLLRMTAGLETITSGEISINGARMNEVHPRNRNIAMVFQNYALYPNMSVFENIAFSLEIKKLGREEIKRRVEEVAAILNLTDYLHRQPKELSGGQRQRAAMGRAMVRDADVFLFDEPLSNLDAKLRAHMRVEIRQLHDRLGATTIYVTHDQVEAMTMADQIVLMRNGIIEQSASPDELYNYPASKFAADFVGTPSMNFLEGSIESDGDAPCFSNKGLRLPLSPDCPAKAGQTVICGLRPTDLYLDKDGPIKGVLQFREKTGAETNLHFSSMENHLVATTSRDQEIRIGANVAFSIDSRRVHLFDKNSEKRI